MKRTSGSPSFIIRQAQQQDLRDLADILVESFHVQTGWIRWLLPVLRMGIYEDLRHRLRSALPHYICLVAIESVDPACETPLVGTVEVALRTVYPIQFQQGQYPYLSNLAVKQEYRRQGVAWQLLKAAEQAVTSWGFEDLYLHVLEDNHRARQLYIKAGYQLKESDPLWWCWLLRRPRRLFLHKRLPP